MTEETEISISHRLIPNLIAFLIGLGLAWFLHWETADLVWSLWLSSLVIGYATILIRIGYGAMIGWKAVKSDDLEGIGRTPAGLIGAGLGLFLLGFFSLHFCGFHAGHSVFLNAFFPLPGLPDDGFGEAFMNPILLWKLVFQHLMIPYGLFLIPALIAERHGVLKPFQNREDGEGDPKAGKAMTEDLFAGPYKNVIRMHLLIFFFAGCHFLKVDAFLVYVVVSAVYFFPWKDARIWWSQGKRAAAE